MAGRFIPVNTPLLGEGERKNLLECIDSGWISSEGPFVGEFEESFSSSVGRGYGVAVSSGSAALDVAVTAIGVGAGDEVIMPAFSIISPAASVVRAGGKPVLVDSDEETWNMDVSLIEERITDRTKAIIVVHTYGLPVDMDPVMEVAERHGLKVIEDAAEAHGLTYKGRPCGSFGDVSIFSFYPNKHVTTGEGGMIVTDDEALAGRCREYRNLCFNTERRFVHHDLGWNYRMTNMQAGLGLAQMEGLQGAVERKRAMGATYNNLLSDISSVQLPLERTDYGENVYWVFGMVLNDEVPFDAIEAMRHLSGVGVGTRPFFYPMHLQPVFNKMGLFNGETYPVAERLGERGFYIPSGLALTEDDMEYVASKVREVLS